ncbi:MAG: bis(5'-nucleosyl)-tetraphosphatase (symmetrical) YqeK [Lachnospiraceae bacterium]|nr:bis(5'-nucleosyl)-tetraphosphatase (symmetrical) YqeK [Lachnospiraceae bacterium]
MKEYSEIIICADEFMHQNLSPHRALHIQGVAIESRRLAVRYGVDPRKAYLAGYLHDCAKGFTRDENIRYITKYDIDISEEELSIGNALIHSKVGAYFAREYFEVVDEDIFNAIYYHTVGRPGMSDLEKIVYVADFIEPQRDQKSMVPLNVLRELSYMDLNRAVCEVTRCCYYYLKDNNSGFVSPDTKKTYDYYIQYHTEN